VLVTLAWHVEPGQVAGFLEARRADQAGRRGTNYTPACRQAVLRVRIQRSYTLEQAGAALQAFVATDSQGKLALTIA
jgi:hypothetical protein